MKHNLKSFLTTPFVCLILSISLALPLSVSAETGTLGTETPHLSCTFTNSAGKRADGNHLKPGTYHADIVLSGMEKVSVIELTAAYDITYLPSMTIIGTYADNHDDMKCGGLKAESGNISVFQVAENGDSSAIDSNGTVMVSLAFTVTSPCDFADVFAFSRNPNLCFIEASYEDGYDDCYVLDTSVETSFNTYPMTADVSPEFVVTEFNVTGKVTAAATLDGAATDVGIAGVTVTLDGTDQSVTTAEDGTFTFTELTDGTYMVNISGPSTIDRNAILVVDSTTADYDQITVSAVGVVNADHNKDGRINSTDVAIYSKYLFNHHAYADYNGDGEWDENDTEIFQNFLFQTVSYTQTTMN